MPSTYPAYLELFESGELARRAQSAVESMAECALCARQCRVDRFDQTDLQSYCRTGRRAWVSSCFPHHGEESCLRGWNGSGTIFFSHCNLRCVFCQNFDISWDGQGREVQTEELAAMMLRLEQAGCHNVSFVTPSHVVPQILEALCAAADRGLRLPLVYNTGGYDHVDTLRLLDGVVDVYMPDFKFWAPEVSKELARAKDYGEVACRAVREMHRQVGDLVVDEKGVAQRGLLVRHLVMPGGLASTREVMRFLAREISPDTYVNVMPQYRPEGFADRYEPIARPLRLEEYREALRIAREEGIWRFNRG
ncbi:MAG: radical SAM protein [Planctomycetota bacterium]|jgi:putative pyruvate formate lyase activating enzyme